MPTRTRPSSRGRIETCRRGRTARPPAWPGPRTRPSSRVRIETSKGYRACPRNSARTRPCRARSGDDVAFEELVRPYHRELQAHCYRILGSATDAEDAFQESLTAAWKGLAGFEGRASFRTWLYRIATGRCLNMVRASRRSPVRARLMDGGPPEASRLGEVLWLEPYPDAILAEVADPTSGPEARYEQPETSWLAVITALQLQPPRPRVALILTDVLDFSARDVADMLDATEHAVY